MKKLIFLLVLVLFTACSDESNPLNGIEEGIGDLVDTKVTVKEKLDDVMAKAKSGYSSDAQLSAIIGRNVTTTGEMDLANFTSVQGFFYMVQSDSKQDNTFYYPLPLGVIQQIPISLNDLLSVVKDENTKSQLGDVFALLSTVSISSNATFYDSDDAMELFMLRGGSAFMNANQGTSIDMFLVPSVTLSTSGVENSADWICHFYSSSKSLLLWLNCGTGIVTEF